MNTTKTIQSVEAEAKRNGILYPLLLIAAIALIIFSVIGIATMTGLMPGAFSKNEMLPKESVSESARAAEPLPALSAQQASPAQQPVAARSTAPTSTRTATPRMAAATTECSYCGVVDSIRAVEVKGGASGLGAVAGGVLGAVLGNQIGGGRGRTAATVVGAGGGAYAGHEIERNMNKNVRYQVSVRMSDGTVRTFTESSQSAFFVGQKVRISNGALVATG